MSHPKLPFAGVSLPAATEHLRGTRARVLDVDWLGMDPSGAIAVFLGGEETPVPSSADAESTSAALERIAASVARRFALTTSPEVAYRVAGSRTQDPIFDPPRLGPREELHEPPFSGYPQLVVAAPGGEAHVRGLMLELGGREVLARDAFAASIEVLGAISNAELHDAGSCGGCRVLADPTDPHPRSAEALAAAGLYVYGHTRHGWVRIASPSVPADRDDLADVGVGAVASLEDAFESTPWLALRPPRA